MDQRGQCISQAQGVIPGGLLHSIVITFNNNVLQEKLLKVALRCSPHTKILCEATDMPINAPISG